MPWRLAFARRAERDLANLPPRDREAVRQAINRVALDAGSVDLRKLGGRSDRWRLRVGTWRVILRLDNRDGVITVLRVVARRDAYRD